MVLAKEGNGARENALGQSMLMALAGNILACGNGLGAIAG